jgi:hypothetical protein
MEMIKIEINSDFKNDTDEMKKLTIQLKKELEAVDTEIADGIEFEKSVQTVVRKGTGYEWGNLLLPAVLSPAATIALVKTLHIWIKSKADTTIAKSVTIDSKNKKYIIKGYSADEVTKILQELDQSKSMEKH